MTNEELISLPVVLSTEGTLGGTAKQPYHETVKQNPTTLSERYDMLHAEFELALLNSHSHPITQSKFLPSVSGVYVLYHSNSLVYIGSTDDIRTRIGQHCKKISGATKIEIESVTYKFALLKKNSAKAAEGELIDHYTPSWNRTGFGRRPGIDNRETTYQSQWAMLYGYVAKTSKPLDDDEFFVTLL